MTNFPPLRVAVLQALVELKDRVMADPDFLDGPDVPYDGEALTVLKKILQPQVVTKVVEKTVAAPKNERGRPGKDVVLSEEDQQKVRDQLQKLIDDVNAMEVSKTIDTKDQIAIARLKSNLIEQLLKLQERAFNVKRMSLFQEVVINILDDLVDEKGRETFLAKIEPYR